MESTLLLAANYEPIDVISWQDAVRLWALEKAEVLEEYDKDLRSMYLVIKMPAVIRLVNMFKKRKKRVKFSRINIYSRDKFRCLYCRKKGQMKDFTFDHVVPKAKGGKTVWSNIVTCCIPCNCKKGSKTLEEANMVLVSTPAQPERLPSVTIRLTRSSVPESWTEYLYWHVGLEE